MWGWGSWPGGTRSCCHTSHRMRSALLHLGCWGRYSGVTFDWTKVFVSFGISMIFGWIVNSHHIVTHFLTDFPVSWLTPLEGECLSLNSVAPWFWSTCRINMASRLSLKCLSATCCLQLSTYCKSNDSSSKICSDCQRPTFARRKLDKTGAASAQAGPHAWVLQWYAVIYDQSWWNYLML